MDIVKPKRDISKWMTDPADTVYYYGVCKHCGKPIVLMKSWDRLDWYHLDTLNVYCEVLDLTTPSTTVAEPTCYQ